MGNGDINQLKELLLKRGASLVGFADLSEIPPPLRQNLPYAVSLAVALDREIVDGAAQELTPVLRTEYNRVNDILKRVFAEAADFLQEKGFEGVRMDTEHVKYDRGKLAARFTHKMAATRGGLGWIGKSGLLVTEKFGSAVRLNTLLTDAKLAVDEPVNSSRCGDCRICTESCPAGAIFGTLWELGTPRDELLDAVSCSQTRRKLAQQAGMAQPTCGRCVAVCPWTRRYIEGKSQR